ncbi:hypothetical protein PsalMR5_00779 [Piscirickettsia salmonis]|uniref:hypothetical protein n=1 Tax=Piscirickettsia salmonis TaxID=1238 RepID=UPI0012BA8F28|nr:hypothetical protein [Piscirickettsia salmonis]QGP53371.1 hypothetical protein PsalSR1_00781 [Piscirickettsia salmonis]QGP60708.1 hypothetical protein PsalBI1_03327 [Piscirickettsia salmonis]QGP62936.1 hypothetical protein PsalMR5_00779 [Piscirickettsia salmonis]
MSYNSEVASYSPLVLWNLGGLLNQHYVKDYDALIKMNEKQAESAVKGLKDGVYHHFNAETEITLNPAKDCVSVNDLRHSTTPLVKKTLRQMGLEDYGNTLSTLPISIVCSPHFSKIKITGVKDIYKS